nr:MAG TPA_asm: hypothetical protein [Caudoviricetes sp.]
MFQNTHSIALLVYSNCCVYLRLCSYSAHNF